MYTRQETFPFTGMASGESVGSRLTGASAKAALDRLVGLVRRMAAERRRRRTEHQLSGLSDFVLKDIGVSRADIGSVARKLSHDPFSDR